MRTAAQQPNAGVAGQVPRFREIDLAVGEQRVDILGGRLDLVHPRPAGGHDILRVVLVGGQAHRGSLHPEGNVLADQRNSLAFGGEVGGAAQNPGVVAVGAKASGQHGRVGVVQFDVKRAALCPNGNRLIQPSVLEPKIIEQAQGLTGEPPQFVVVAFGLQFADHHQRHHHLVFGEPTARPRIGQQHGGVEHIGPDIGHEALLERVSPRGPAQACRREPQHQDRGRSCPCSDGRCRPGSKACRWPSRTTLLSWPLGRRAGAPRPTRRHRIPAASHGPADEVRLNRP